MLTNMERALIRALRSLSSNGERLSLLSALSSNVRDGLLLTLLEETNKPEILGDILASALSVEVLIGKYANTTYKPIEAMKQYRGATGEGLKEAKDFIESLTQGMSGKLVRVGSNKVDDLVTGLYNTGYWARVK